jgi:trimeric autotransporter adhesin
MIRKIKINILWAVLPVLLLSCGMGSDPVLDHSLPPPLLYLPRNHATGQETTLDLSWTLVYQAVDYDIQVAKDSTFSNLIAQHLQIPGTTSPVTQSVSGLLPASVYYWHVRSRRTGRVVSEWTPVWTFKTIAATP